MSALRRRLRFKAKPALALLSGAGDLLHIQYARLYPAYHINAVEMSDWSESLLTSRDMVGLVHAAEEKWKRQEARLRTLEARADASSSFERALIMRDRAWPQRAHLLLTRAVEREDHLQAREALARLEVDREQPRRARDQYTRLIEAHPTHARHARWRFERARLMVRSASTPGTGKDLRGEPLQTALATLHAFTEDDASEELAIRSQLALAAYADASDDDDTLRKRLTWLRARVGSGTTAPPPWSAEMLTALLELESGRGSEGREAARKLVWQLVLTFPDSVEAQVTKHGRLADLTVDMDPR